MIWNMLPICVFWRIWRERNNRCFENLESYMEEILASLLYSLYLWNAAYLSPLSLSCVDFFSRFSFSSWVFFLYISYVLLGRLTLFNKILMTYQKKKSYVVLQ